MWKSNEKKYGIYLFSAYLCSVWASWSVSCTGCYIHYKNIKTLSKSIYMDCPCCLFFDMYIPIDS